MFPSEKNKGCETIRGAKFASAREDKCKKFSCARENKGYEIFLYQRE